MVSCSVVCSSLMEELCGKEYGLQVHSVFHQAANFSSPIGFVTVLAPQKGVQPFSAVLKHPYSFEDMPKRGLRIGEKGIFRNEEKLFSFEGAESRSLKLGHRPSWKAESPERLLAFLRHYKEKGLVEMAFGGQGSIYAEFLAPRLKRFRTAARQKEEGQLIESAWQMAGCGVGLTPSSDDLLCGYLAGIWPAWPQELVRRVANRAAARTNDISRALLCQAGTGRFSWDVLQVLCCMEEECTDGQLGSALEKVASFGSSSGCDFLTGLYFGIQDALESSINKKIGSRNLEPADQGSAVG